MPKYKITGPDGQSYEVSAPDDATEDQVLAYAQKNFKMAAAPKASKPFGQQVNDFVADVPRALGRTARVGLQGVGGMLDLAASPIRGALNMLPGVDIQPGGGRVLADALRLPKPQPGMESAADSGAEMVVGGAIPLGLGAAATKFATGVTQSVGRMAAANPAQQLASAGAAGTAGGYTRETGGNDTSQLLASLAAGAATPFAMSAAGRGGQAAAQALRSRPAPSPVQVDVTINNAIQPSGMTLAQLPAEVAAGIRADVAKAMQIGDDLSPDAVRRLADYRLTGATPNRAGLTLDPAVVTQQRNLAKLGINSKDPAAQELGQMQNANNKQLISGLNSIGGNTADDALAGGQKIMGALQNRNDAAQTLIGKSYAEARDTLGRSMDLDPAAFANTASDLLDYHLVGAKLPTDVRKLLNRIADGSMPFTVDVAEQFKTRIGDLQRISTNGGEIKALGIVRNALDQAPLLNDGQGFGQQSIDAFNRARGLNRSWMETVEKTPALNAIREGIEPDRFVQRFVIGAGNSANVMDVAMLKNSIKSNPDAMTAVREQIVSYLKKAAINGANDEVGNFSQSAYNKALRAVGERKLKLFFPAEDINQLNAIGRVASYEQFQPRGSAVNNSNTASAGMAAMLDRIGSSAMLSKIPLGKLVADPMQNIAVSMQSKRVLDVPQSLTDGVRQPLLPPPQRSKLAMSPAALMGIEDEETRRRREAGLLLP